MDVLTTVGVADKVAEGRLAAGFIRILRSQQKFGQTFCFLDYLAPQRPTSLVQFKQDIRAVLTLVALHKFTASKVKYE